ncbi:MAG: hypothetical protein M3680_14210 [Myxococcota bacterium]|nr:hypothetical protein [Myxococcota bacterium]
MRQHLGFATMLAIALVGGCGKKDDAKGGAAKDDKAAVDPALPKTVAGGCDYADTGICTFNKESDPTQCTALGGKFTEGECPKENAVPGTCLCKSEYNTEIKTYYTTTDAKYTAEIAKDLCTKQQCEWQGS